MKKFVSCLGILSAVFALISAWSVTALAAPVIAPISGEIERITLNEPANIYSGGVMIVGGIEVILPKNLLIDLPANRLSLWQIFDQAPALCKSNGESGLAKADRCNASGTGGFAALSAVNTNAGNVIAGDVFIQKGIEVVAGRISYISYSDGFYRVNGLPNDPATGVMVRLNDPTSRHTVQQGLGCAGGPNCSPDPRFTLDPDNYTNTFSTGYPVCIPSTLARNFVDALGLGTTVAQASATGAGDVMCPDTNRTPAALLEPAVADSRRFAPVVVGDSVTAEGNYETVNGVRFLSAHTTNVLKALSTRNALGQPDYLFLEEVFIEAPGFQNQRARAMWIGFTTLAPTDVDIWSIHRDPVTNAINEFPLASVQGCDNAGGTGTCAGTGLVNAGLNIFRIRYDVDFLLGNPGNPGFTPGGAKPKLSPCDHLKASRFATSNPGLCPGGTTLANNIGIMSPIPHEIIARTGRKIDSATNAAIGNLVTLDINGREATNGEYLFPLGLNLGGIEVAEFNEIDLNALNTPVIFEGIPWNLDRRLSPSGCLNGGCEPLGSSPMGTFALDPFPFTGLDPRTQADFAVAGLGTGGLPTGSYSDPVFNNSANPLGNVRNRIFSFVDAALGKPNGNATVLPYALGTFPADPPLIAINPTPIPNIFSPVAVDDATTTQRGVPATINVLANDIPILGVIDPATVSIVSSTPANGTLQVNSPFPGYITYTPTATFAGTNTFTYTVKNNVGAVSNAATVTVSVASPPVANNDTAFITTGQPITINVTANDTPGSVTSALNKATVVVTTPTGGTASAVGDGTVIYTAPAAPGSYTFSYTVQDNSVPPQTSNSATVTVTVTSLSLAPVANNDTAAANVNSLVNINVIANDTSTTSAIDPASLVVTAPLGFTAVAHVPGDGTVDFTAPAAAGTYVFSYTVKDSAIPPATSNSAFVTVTVTAPNIAPVANNDAATLNLNLAANIAIDVLANDVDTDGINPASVVIVAQPLNGAATVNPVTGAVTYTPATGFIGQNTFTYTVRDNLGALSNTATVTVTVTAPTNESLSVTRAEFQVGGASWRIEGTTTERVAGETMNIFNSATVPADGTTGLLGTATVDTTGRWRLSLNGPTPNAQLRISVQSSLTPTPAKLEGVTLVVR